MPAGAALMCGRPDASATMCDVDAVQVEETRLPGIGLRHDFVTASGRRIGVVSHRTGRRDFLVYDEADPDASREVVQLTGEEADALAEFLGAPRVIERLGVLNEQVEGLVTEQLPIQPESRYAGRTLGETETRTRTGASIVAVLREGAPIVSPGPDFRFAAGDTLLVVGTAEGVAGVTEILRE